MPLTLYNTLSRRKEPFAPLDARRGVRMYVCGPTVYDRIHVGNARPFVVFDVLYRLLRHEYGRQGIAVTYIRNITDIDDKINARAKERGVSIRDLTHETSRQFFADVKALGCLEPDVEPRATDHVPQMIALIATLIARGHAYAADGHVLFNVPSMPAYGRLSGRNRDELIAGARVEIAPYKKDPADFVLWKPSTPDLPGWDSPWGRGRPGWHIECSAMAEAYLGEQFDIHGGGIDLIFPHHENEIAQSECAHDGRPFARFWVHNGFLQSEGQKMAKSLGNFYTVDELLQEFAPEAIRFLLLNTHYRKELDFSKEGLTEAVGVLDYWNRALRDRRLFELRHGLEKGEFQTGGSDLFFEELSNDLNTHQAIDIVGSFAKEVFSFRHAGSRRSAQLGLYRAASFLGLIDRHEPSEWGQHRITVPAAQLRLKSHAPMIAVDESEIERLINDRAHARKSKNFAEADRIRQDLLKRGIVLEDGPGGTTWRRAG